MNKYIVVVEGKNFLIKDAETEIVNKTGFYATRFVEAENEVVAENNALELIRQELSSPNILHNEKSDPPMMYIEEVKHVESFGDQQVPGQGFTFYKE